MDANLYPAAMTDTYSAPVAPRRPAWLIPLIIAAVVLMLAIIGAGAWLLLANRTIDVAGDVAVADSATPYDGSACVTDGGFVDIRRGAQVVIKNSAGAVVATTTLGSGISKGGACTFAFNVEVPTGSDFYGVELGRRGTVQFTADQLADGVHLTIGG